MMGNISVICSEEGTEARKITDWPKDKTIKRETEFEAKLRRHKRSECNS